MYDIYNKHDEQIFTEIGSLQAAEKLGKIVAAYSNSPVCVRSVGGLPVFSEMIYPNGETQIIKHTHDG